MALNTAPSIDALLAFVDSLPLEVQAEIGDLSDIEGGYKTALDMFHASGAAPAAPKKERAVRDYRVLLLNENTSSFEDLGVHAGSPGRAPSDPSKMNALQKTEESAKVRIALAKRKGMTLTLVKIAMGED